MSLTTFNKYPYFDDFDPAKNYVKTLFKPGHQLQVRELNAIQSQSGDQLKKFAGAIFSNGSRITGARTTFTPASKYLLTDTLPTTVLLGHTLNSTTGLTAVISHIEQTDLGSAVFYSIASSGDDAATVDFSLGESLTITAADDVVLSTNDVNSMGVTPLFSIEEGVFYYEGYFIETATQSIAPVLNSSLKEYKIGFDVVDEQVSHLEDPSLTDNAGGFLSEGAPGADRYKVSGVLSVRRRDPASSGKFISLAEMTSTGYRTFKEFTEYSGWGDMLAKRTFEESGNYSIKPFSARVLEHKKASATDPTGWDVNGSEDNFVALIRGGNTAYVEGYRVDIPIDVALVAPKARQITAVTGQTVARSLVSSFKAKVPAGKSFFPNNANAGSFVPSTVELRDGVVSGGVVSGALIGSAVINSMLWVSGTVGSGTEIYQYFFSNITMNSGASFSDVKSMGNVSNTWTAGPDVGTSFTVTDSFNKHLIIDIGQGFPLKSLSSVPDGISGELKAEVQTRLMGTVSGGTATFALGSGNMVVDTDHAIALVKVGGTTWTPTPITAITAPASGTVTVTVSGSHNGLSIMVLAGVVTAAVPIKTKTRTTITDTFTTVTTGQLYTLTKTDVIAVSKIVLQNKTVPLDNYTLTIADFKLFNGQTDTTYVEGTLKAVSAKSYPSAAVLADYNLEVTYDYFSHAGSGVFTIDSYEAAQVKNVPVYVTSGNVALRLNNCIDFRPTILGGALTLDAPLITPKSIVTHDAARYLPRIDTIDVKTDGSVVYKVGEPSMNPVAPLAAKGAMTIYEVAVAPYTFSLSDVVMKRIETKRYTMKDISSLERRIKNAEYYTALSLLEKSAESMSIKGADGLDRFKNGFIADDFSKYQAADLQNPEFRASLDRRNGELRPSFTTRNRKLTLVADESSNYVIRSGMLMSDYDEEVAIKNQYATKSISINPFLIFNKTGQMTLTPHIDAWSDDKVLPVVDFVIDAGVEEFKNAMGSNGANIVGTEWGAWTQQGGAVLAANSTTGEVPAVNKSNVTASADTRPGGSGYVAQSGTGKPLQAKVAGVTLGSSAGGVQQTGYDSNGVPLAGYEYDSSYVAPTVNSEGKPFNSTRTGSGATIGSRSDTHSWDQVSDITIKPYMRAGIVKFNATGLSPNTIHYAFFGDVPVDEFCTAYTSNKTLTSDSVGRLSGEFHIPANTFFTGQKEFVLSTTLFAEQFGTDADYSSAVASYYSGGLDISRQEINSTVISPTLSVRAVHENTGAPPLPPRVRIPPPPPARVNACAGSRNKIASATCSGTAYSVYRYTGEGDFTTLSQCPTYLEYWDGVSMNCIGSLPPPSPPVPAPVPTPTPTPAVVASVCSKFAGLASTTTCTGTTLITRRYTGEGNFSVLSQCPTYLASSEPRSDRCTQAQDQTLANLQHLMIFGSRDPVAQSFKFEETRAVTSVDIFFATRDATSSEVWVSIRELVNGYPTATDMAIKRFTVADSMLSADGQTATNVTFDTPVTCTAGKEYCFVIGGDSPGTRVWVSRVGDEIVNGGGAVVETQPSLGSCFKSQNGTTWNAEQLEDIKFTLKTAKFKSTGMKLTFAHENEREDLGTDPYEVETGVSTIRVYHAAHGLNKGDKVFLYASNGMSFSLQTVTGGAPEVGQTLSTSTGSGVIKTTVYNTVTGSSDVTLERIVGYFAADTAFTCDALERLDASGNVLATAGASSGNILATSAVSNLNGIPVADMVGEQIVSEVDGVNTFKYELKGRSRPLSSGRCGGTGNQISSNFKYDVFNVSGAYMLNGATESWNMTGIGHNADGGPFASKNYKEMPAKSFLVAADTFLDQPYKIASDANQELFVSNKRSVKVIANLTSPSVYSSPVLNIESFSGIFVSNNVGWFDAGSADVPNSDDFWQSEETTTGSETYKYVSKTVSLASPASDLVVAFDVFKDANADFEVWYKVVYAHEVKKIDSVNWVNVTNILKRNSIAPNDRIEYNLTLSEVFGAGWSGKEFSQFKVKLVGKTRNSSSPPLFRSFRSVAVT